MRSIGAVKVLAMAPEKPPNAKSIANLLRSAIAATQARQVQNQAPSRHSQRNGL